MMDANLSGLTQLVRELLDRQSESRSLDYKAAMSFGPTKQDKAEILKCIIAFANTRDGGYMLVGVDQVTGKFVPSGIAPHQAASFDPTKIGDFAKNHCSVLPQVGVHVVSVDGTDLLLVRVEEFTDEPIVCTRDLHDANGQQLILRAGGIYVRTADARCVAIESGEAMRAFLDLAVQKRGDALLGQIRRLVGGPEIVESSGPSDAYAPELTAAHELFDSVDLRGSYWYLEVLPTDYEQERVDSNARLREIRRESVVSIRGWDFPHVDKERDHAFQFGIESITHWARYHEAHRLYRSGLFAWRRQLGGDFAAEYANSLSYESSIYSLTEFFIFASRYASLVATKGAFVVRLGLSGLGGHSLRSEPGVLHGSYETAAASFERSYQLSIEELRASHLDVAADATRHLFELFDLDIPIDVIKDWQQKFIERRF
jgi:hypothetical protein